MCHFLHVEYQPPMVTNVTPTNAPTASVGKEIHVQGASFGFYDSTPKAKVVSTDCRSISWTSDSSLTCTVSHGLGSPSCGRYESEKACYDARCNTEASFEDTSCRVIAVTVGAQRGSLVGLFSFDAPEVLQLRPTNAPATGGLNVTLMGSNFGIHADYKHKGVAGVRDCRSSAWQSDSSVVCEVAPFTGTGYRLGVNLLPDKDDPSLYHLKSVTFRSPMLSYDRPTITAFVPPRAPTKADVMVTAIGQNFGTAPCGGDCKEFSELAIRLGDTMCTNTQWMADSSVVCAIGLCECQ